MPLSVLSRRRFLAAGLGLAGLAAAPPPPLPHRLWSLDLGSASYGGGAVADLDGTGPAIVFGTYYNDEHLYCVDAASGAVPWKFRSEGGPFDASVALVDLDGDKKLEV